MLEVKIDNIIPVTEARDSFNQLIDKVEGTDEMYVLTKNGKPSAILVGVHHLEKLTGTSHEELMKGIGVAENANLDETDKTAVTPVATQEVTPEVKAPVAEEVVEPATPVSSTPVEPVVAPAEPEADSGMLNAQDSPFSYDSNTDQSAVPEVPETEPEAAVPESVNTQTPTPTPAPTSTDQFAMPSTPVNNDTALPEDTDGSQNNTASTPPAPAV